MILPSCSHLWQLPWSTAHEDLVELFETTGQVEQAEILFEGARSKGAGVVQFSQTTEAETAIGEWFLERKSACLKTFLWCIAKFQQYMYGGRPLGNVFSIREIYYTKLVGRCSLQ